MLTIWLIYKNACHAIWRTIEHVALRPQMKKTDLNNIKELPLE